MTHTHSGQSGRLAPVCPGCRRLYRLQQSRWDQNRLSKTAEPGRGRLIIQGLMIRGYSLPFIASEVGVSKTHVSDWLNGNRPVTLSHDARLMELARTFGDVPAPVDAFPRAEKTRSLARSRGYRPVTVRP